MKCPKLEQLTKDTTIAESIVFDEVEITRILCNQLGWQSEATKLVVLGEKGEKGLTIGLTRVQTGVATVNWD